MTLRDTGIILAARNRSDADRQAAELGHVVRYQLTPRSWHAERRGWCWIEPNEGPALSLLADVVEWGVKVPLYVLWQLAKAAAVPLLGLAVLALAWLGLCDVIHALWPHGLL